MVDGMAKDDPGRNLQGSLEEFQKNVVRAGPSAVASYTLIGAILLLGGIGYAVGSGASSTRGTACSRCRSGTRCRTRAGGAPGAGAPGGGRGAGRGGGQQPATPVAFNPAQDTILANGGYSLYSVIASPADDSVWGVAETFPGYLIRVKIGNNPPETCMTQIFKVPSPGLDPRGVDIDSNGVVWTALAASSHLASFDVRKCTDLNNPPVEKMLDGSLCANGWKLFQTTGPRFQGTDIPTEFHYFNWTDQQGASGFPPNTPMATGSNSDSINVLVSQNGAGTVGRSARSLSAWLLRPRSGCSQRRSAITRDRLQRMEEPRDLVQLRNTLRVAHRRWQGRQGQGS